MGIFYKQSIQQRTSQQKLVQQPTILVIETDLKLAHLLDLQLGHEGYQVSLAHDGLAGLTQFQQIKPVAVIIGWNLMGISGLEICQQLRKTGYTNPIILLTAVEQPEEMEVFPGSQSRIKGLNAGADDCLTCPFSTEELIARIRAQLRWRQDQLQTLRFEDLVLDRNLHQAYRNDCPISLTAKEFDLLEYLMLHPKRVLTRVQILDHVWGYESNLTSNVIETYIRYLRVKLEAHGQRLIHTVRHVGYVLRDTSYQ